MPLVIWTSLKAASRYTRRRPILYRQIVASVEAASSFAWKVSGLGRSMQWMDCRRMLLCDSKACLPVASILAE
jgi:hypothetical protein